MAAHGFGLPTKLLSRPPPNTAPNLPQSTALSAPPPPSFADFKFQSIGQQPGLLKRFSETLVVQGSADDENMSPSSESEQNPNYDLEQDRVPQMRPSLWQALVEPVSALAIEPSANDHRMGPPSLNPTRPSMTQSTVSRVSDAPHVSEAPQNVSKEQRFAPPTSAQTSPAPLFHSRTHITMTSSPTDGHRDPTDLLGSMQLRYPSQSPGPSAIAELSMKDNNEHFQISGGLSPSATRKYDGLREIQTRLRSHLLNLNSPNLTSATLLTESANSKAAAVLAEARRVYSFSQETLKAAQKSVTAAKAILTAAEEVQGLADSAKAELERISLKDANHQREVECNEIRDLLQSLANWVSNQEAHEVRARGLQQLQVEKVAPNTKQFTSTGPSLGRPSSNSEPVPHPAISRAKQPLFFSPTPEVDVMVKSENRDQSLSQIRESRGADGLVERQVVLRKRLEEKRRSSAEAESQDGLPSEVVGLKKQRQEELEKGKGRRDEEEHKRKDAEKRVREAAKVQENVHEPAATERGVHEVAEAEKQHLGAFLAQQKREQEMATRQAKETERVALERQEREQRMHQERTQMRAEQERGREEKLRQEQEIRRQQIQADKNKTMADRAQQIRALREQQVRSLDMSNEMPLELGPVVPHISSSLPAPPNSLTAKPTSSVPLARPGVSNETSVDPSFAPQVLPSQTSENLIPSNSGPTEIAKPNTLDHEGQHPLTVLKPVTPIHRNVSLPPVAHLSPNNSPPTQFPSSSSLSVHRQSDDTGNVPLAKNPVLSPQAQVANLRHVVSALQLPPLKVSSVKVEPDQDDALLLQAARKAVNEITHSEYPPSAFSQQAIQGVGNQSNVVLLPTAVSPKPSYPAKPTGSHPTASREQHIPSSSTTDAATGTHNRPQQAQENQNQQQELGGPKPSSILQNNTNNHSVLPNQSPMTPSSTNARPRSESPLRMGPDIYIPSPVVESDNSSDTRDSAPFHRGRPEVAAPPRWDHYSPSPPRNSTYRPYLSRPSSPTVAGKKRSRDYSPPPPVIRDYRESDNRRPPPSRRRSRSPPSRRNRLSRSPSPSQNRPPLASRLTQGLSEGHRPPSPRDSSRPELLDRFTDPRGSNPPASMHPLQQPSRIPPTRPLRGRGKRGRGGSGPASGFAHAPLEKRISSGTTLMHRLEDPPRP